MMGLANAVATAGSELTGPPVARLRQAVLEAGRPGLKLKHRAKGLLDGRALEVAYRLNEAWSDVPDTDAQVVVAMLDAAGETAAKLRQQHTTDLVWTGPPSTEFDARPTRDALLTVIRAAEEELFLASFVGYLVDDVEEALKERLAAGVVIRMLLETPDEAASHVDKSGWNRYKHLQKAGWQIEGLRWPADQRPKKDSATQHAKVAVADDRMMLITSANLTDRALTHNMELGVLLKGGTLPAAVQRHFRDLQKRSVITSII